MEKLYQNAEKFYQYTTKLDMMVTQYNRIVTRILPVERALVAHRLTEIDAQLDKVCTFLSLSRFPSSGLIVFSQGLRHLNWKSAGIKEFVDAVCTGVAELSTVLLNVSHAVDAVQRLLDNWSAAPLLERRDAKKLLNLEEERTRVCQAPFVDVRRGGKRAYEVCFRWRASSRRSAVTVAKSPSTCRRSTSSLGLAKVIRTGRTTCSMSTRRLWRALRASCECRSSTCSTTWIPRPKVCFPSRTFLLSPPLSLSLRHQSVSHSDAVVEHEQLDATRQRVLQFTGPSVKKVEQASLIELEMKLVGEDLVFEPGIDGGTHCQHHGARTGV
jgi:hypothetical protein